MLLLKIANDPDDMMENMFTAYPLRPGRVHEAGGPGAGMFALRAGAQVNGDLLWVRQSWLPEQLNPLGFDGFDPSRLLMARTRDQTDTLAVAEEALRDGCLGLVVMDITAPLSLTAGRRLQLAAQSGGTTGLCLIPEGVGSNAAETRWHCAPVFDADDSTLQCWTLIKNKSGTTGSWHVRWDAKARRIAVVSPARE
ncbi:ImuA family protein [Paracoccus sp. p4-l81]|uniref:ImuA family protein n=1 Tax=Paracoccus sp. p4-l81 TaxID=3342806 RepID=UPI0035B9A7C5